MGTVGEVEEVKVAEEAQEVAANVTVLSQFMLFKLPRRYFHSD